MFWKLYNIIPLNYDILMSLSFLSLLGQISQVLLVIATLGN
jgi:hypothetical protein